MFLYVTSGEDPHLFSLFLDGNIHFDLFSCILLRPGISKYVIYTCTNNNSNE